jgi:hypothetical protein
MNITYKQTGELNGSCYEQLQDILCQSFGDCRELAEFVREELDRQLSYRYSNFTDLSWLSFNLIGDCGKIGLLGSLVGALMKRDPANVTLNGLVAELESQKVIVRVESTEAEEQK